MKVSSANYVPVLSWRQAEYQALFRLPESAKAKIVPLIAIPRIEFDFETYQPKHTVEEHVGPFPKKFAAKWGNRPAWLDIDSSLWNAHMPDGTSIHEHVFKALVAQGCRAVPVAHLDSPAVVLSAMASLVPALGVGMRIGIGELTSPDASAKLTLLLAALNASSEQTDLLVDLGSPNYEPIPIFVNALRHALTGLNGYTAFRSIVVLGTAFPESLKNIHPPGAVLPRTDWTFYRAFRAASAGDPRLPVYGDYATVAPGFAADFDMRVVKPAGKLVYTTATDWIVKKGGSFRGDPAQMHKHCQSVIASGLFRGSGFSFGDKYIQECAVGAAPPSNLTRWKEVGISHHIMQVLDDLSIPPSTVGAPAQAAAVV